MHSNNLNSTLSSSCWKVFLIYARCMIYLSCFFIKVILKNTQFCFASFSAFFFTKIVCRVKRYSNIQNFFCTIFWTRKLNLLEVRVRITQFQTTDKSNMSVHEKILFANSFRVNCHIRGIRFKEKRGTFTVIS